MDWFVYMLLCSDGSIYTGRANNVQEKFEQHCQGKASTYTSSRLPVKLVYATHGMTKKQSSKKQIVLRALPQKEKLKLADEWHETHKECNFRLPPED